MTPEQWQRIRPILESALELDASKRAHFLDSACEDSYLRHEVESLIAIHEGAGAGFLDSPPVPHPAPEEELRFRLACGKRVGPYEILGEIAQGGMGAVYRAVRADGQYKQEVALKVVRAEFSGQATAVRFRNERQILANLDHPNIAKILDGGTTAEGIPYFAMELIEGLPLTDYCDQHKLTVDARLKIFRTVCSAVHYAHQHLVIHRDIKPTNILVTPDGVPKLLDFGIAKILDPTMLPENLTLTVGGFSMMTPEYASPEQLSGAPLTTATDVYSLGLILFELLAGRLPFRFVSKMPHDVARAVLEGDPEKPSTATVREEPSEQPTSATLTPQLIRDLHSDSLVKLRRRLSGDLDNIVLKALRKEPAARYSSADQLSDDIRRHLEGVPVLARKSSFPYRCRKYLQRHKVGVAAAALIAASLLTGMVLTLREARIARANQLRAENRFNDVRALANSLMFEVHDSIRNLAGATPARKLLVSKALQYLDSLSKEASGDASLQTELAAAYEKVGDVQGYPDTANLGDTEGALASYQKALAIRESFARNTNIPENQQNLASDYERIGRTSEARGNYREALEFLHKDFLIRKALAEAAPSAKSHEFLAGAYFLMAGCYFGLQDTNSALENYQKSAAIRETIASESPIVQTRLAGTYGFMAPILWNKGDHAEAMLVQRKATEIMKKLSDSDPNNATYREYLDEAYYWTGSYQEKDGDRSQALVNYRRALGDFQGLAAADPHEVRTREYVAMCHSSIGRVLIAKGDFAQGLESTRKAISIYEQQPGFLDDVSAAYETIGVAYSRLAVQPRISRSESLANWAQARAAYQKSLDGWQLLLSRGELVSSSAEVLNRLKGELSKCNAAIPKKSKDGM